MPAAKRAAVWQSVAADASVWSRETNQHASQSPRTAAPLSRLGAGGAHLRRVARTVAEASARATRVAGFCSVAALTMRPAAVAKASPPWATAAGLLAAAMMFVIACIAAVHADG